jgi:hypothetical protein
MWETLPNPLLTCLADLCRLRINDARTRSTVSSRGRQPELFFLAQMQPVSANDLCHLHADFLVSASLPQSVQNHHWANAAEWFCSNCTTHLAFPMSVNDCSAPTSGDQVDGLIMIGWDWRFRSAAVTGEPAGDNSWRWLRVLGLKWRKTFKCW